MSGALPEGTARSLASGRATIGSMLSAAQTHLKKVFLVFVTTMLLTLWALRAFIWERLEQDLVFDRMDVTTEQATEIIVVTPFDVILLQVKIGIVMGILVSIPVLLWYSRDALRQRGYWPSSTIPRWKVWSFVAAISLLFLGGISYAYFFFFPIMFDFLAANAVQAGFKPTWSIVMWTEFIFFLALSFGLAAQLPLLMSATSRTGIVPYETYRNKWKYAVVGIFVFGAMFSPPDPFTQVMWGVPLVLLYFVSLGIAKLAVLSKRAGEQVTMAEVARAHWNMLAGTAFLTAVAVYAYLTEGGVQATNDLLAAVGSRYRVVVFLDDPVAFGLDAGVAAALVGVAAAVPVAGVVLFYYRIQELERRLEAAESGGVPADEQGAETGDEGANAGEPAEIDIGAMGAPALKATSAEAFVDLSEERALHYAEQALEDDDPEKAKAVLDRFDEAQEYQQEQEEEEEEEDEEAGIVTSTAAGIVDPFTEDETTEDDIGGYYYDIRFILDSLTSRAMWIVGTFMVVLAGSFMWLYLGGIGQIREMFFQNMPDALVDEPEIVVLHPVEALIFMLKFSTLLAAVSILPLVLYFAWPAIEDRGLSSGDRNVLLWWGGMMFLAVFGGTFLGFVYIAPTILSLLATDVVLNDMIIAYRISSFGWLVIYLTVGVGLLAMIPVTMVLFNHGNIISYRRMRKSWRGVILAFFAAAGLLSPSGIWTMFIVAIPMSIAYGFGLGLVWLYSGINRRVRQPWGEAAD